MVEASRMNTSERPWDLLILDAAPPARALGGPGIVDLDEDGEPEIVCGEPDPFRP